MTHNGSGSPSLQKPVNTAPKCDSPNMREPIFSRQEQGVVYLFSRYWDRIDIFKGKRIDDIHTHFPDFRLKDTTTDAPEAIEFEYGLSNFWSHMHGDLKWLKKKSAKLLYIVYWEEDDDSKEWCRRIKEWCRKKHFKVEVTLVPLSDYFSPHVERESDHLGAYHLGAYWVFSGKKKKKRFPEVYTFETIAKDTDSLIGGGEFEPLKVKELYRTIGFNKSRSDYIECDHWQTIHFFTTTTRFQEHKIPSQLFLKSTGCKYFAGYFDVERAFRIKKDGPGVEEYFRNYYFYPYNADDYESSTCLVYWRFRKLTYKQGSELYKYLKNADYALGQSPEVIDTKHIHRIQRIIQ